MLSRHGSHEVSPLAQSGSRSPMSDVDLSSVPGSETSSRATSTTRLHDVDDVQTQQQKSVEDLAATSSEGVAEGGVASTEDRQPVAVLPQSPKQARKALALDMIEEGEEPQVAAAMMRRPRSHTDPGWCGGGGGREEWRGERGGDRQTEICVAHGKNEE